MNAIEGYARANATIISHELGHSLGVAFGNEAGTGWPDPYPPYHGFGGYSAFGGTLGHINLAGYEPYGYFPGAAAPILHAGISGYMMAIHPGTSYTSFDKAYLLGKTYYLADYPDPGCASELNVCTEFPKVNPCWAACIDQCPPP